MERDAAVDLEAPDREAVFFVPAVLDRVVVLAPVDLVAEDLVEAAEVPVPAVLLAAVVRDVVDLAAAEDGFLWVVDVPEEDVFAAVVRVVADLAAADAGFLPVVVLEAVVLDAADVVFRAAVVPDAVFFEAAEDDFLAVVVFEDVARVADAAGFLAVADDLEAGVRDAEADDFRVDAAFDADGLKTSEPCVEDCVIVEAMDFVAVVFERDAVFPAAVEFAEERFALLSDRFPDGITGLDVDFDVLRRVPAAVVSESVSAITLPSIFDFELFLNFVFKIKFSNVFYNPFILIIFIFI